MIMLFERMNVDAIASGEKFFLLRIISCVGEESFLWKRAG